MATAPLYTQKTKIQYQAATITTTTKNKKREKKETVGVWFNV
jgi:hypothetical protein